MTDIPRRTFLQALGVALGADEAHGQPMRDAIHRQADAEMYMLSEAERCIAELLIDRRFIKMNSTEALTEKLSHLIHAHADVNARVPRVDYMLAKKSRIIERMPPLNLCIRMSLLDSDTLNKYIALGITLLHGGTDVNALSAPHLSEAALTLASRKNSLPWAQMLLAHGAAPNMRNALGNTALHYAYAHENTELKNLLLAAGADKTIVNHPTRAHPKGQKPRQIEKIPPGSDLIGQTPPPAQNTRG